ncbi:MAG: DegT/DnrJ/EryC1/StrS family aminotransferase [Opitutaceae bacterium]
MSRIYLSPPDISASDHASVDAVLTSNWVAPVGPHLVAFESEVAQRCGVANAVALNSGTAALHLALMLMDVKAGDKVICPTLTFAASANPICYLGAEPIFVDCESKTWNIDPALLEEALQKESGVKAVIVVHLYGQCAQMDEIAEVCKRHDVPIIEDAAEALGASYRGQAAGSFGALSFFSFNGNKIITTSGGGMLLSDNKEWIDRARYLASQAREPVAHYEHKEVGYNYRMSNVLAGLGSSQLSDLDRRISTRRGHYDFYRDAFADLESVEMMPIVSADENNYWLSCFTINSKAGDVSRDSILAAFAAAEIEARPIWKPLHLQPVFSKCASYGGSCAEAIFNGGICLPSGSSLTDAERDEVVSVVRSCF